MSAVVTRSGNSAHDGAWSRDPATARPSVWAGRGEALLCPDRGGAGGGAALPCTTCAYQHWAAAAPHGDHNHHREERGEFRWCLQINLIV